MKIEEFGNYCIRKIDRPLEDGEVIITWDVGEVIQGRRKWSNDIGFSSREEALDWVKKQQDHKI